MTWLISQGFPDVSRLLCDTTGQVLKWLCLFPKLAAGAQGHETPRPCSYRQEVGKKGPPAPQEPQLPPQGPTKDTAWHTYVGNRWISALLSYWNDSVPHDDCQCHPICSAGRQAAPYVVCPQEQKTDIPSNLLQPDPRPHLGVTVNGQADDMPTPAP